VVVLWINVPVEFSLLYTTRSSLDLAFKQYNRTRILVWVGPERATRAMARQAELTGKLAFSAQTFLWSGNLSQERYNSLEPVPKRRL
jgi:hypothetical protein